MTDQFIKYIKYLLMNYSYYTGDKILYSSECPCFESSEDCYLIFSNFEKEYPEIEPVNILYNLNRDKYITITHKMILALMDIGFFN